MGITGIELLEKEINEIYKYAYKIIDKGTLGKRNQFDLSKILEIHQDIKIGLEDLNYTLSQDISRNLKIEKAISRKIDFISFYKKMLGYSDTDIANEKTAYLQWIETILNKLYGYAIMKTSQSLNSFCFSIQMDEYSNDYIGETAEFIIKVTADATIHIDIVLLEYGNDTINQKYIINYIQNLDDTELNYHYAYKYDDIEKSIVIFTIINLWNLEDTLSDINFKKIVETNPNIENDISNVIEKSINNIFIDIQTIFKKRNEATEKLFVKKYIDKLPMDDTGLAKFIEYDIRRISAKEKVVNNAFKKTLIAWIEELQDIFSSISGIYEMEDYLDSELEDILIENGDNLSLHYSMLIDKLEDTLTQHKELRKDTDLLELITEIKRCEDDVL